ncbi:phosphatidate phosphatase [Paragonimus westermani]|uniref:Phosphatidate phosphatase n=1 Tax=Paragonimus westermani TaxID=34504 RepID=A0A5J4N9X8_9TREM|nr:phosphatidate phosphatase [Paragonimus westermani]
MANLLSYKSQLAVRITSDLLLGGLPFGHKQLGFHLNDDTIKLPYKVNTISTLGVSFYGYVLPILTVITVELFTALFRHFALDERNVWRQMFYFMYNFVVTYLVAAGVCFLLTTVIKYNFGRLRPYFLEICQPDILPSAAQPYVDSYTCRGTNRKAMEAVFLSFLSGHASTATVGVTYAVVSCC